MSKGKFGGRLSKLDFLRYIVSETARMSYPGRFSLKKGAKSEILEYFANTFPKRLINIKDYNRWHNNRVEELSKVVRRYKRNKEDKPFALSAKLVNTFMHQLMKYDRFRYLYNNLHLPLDKSVFGGICTIIPRNDKTELHFLRERAMQHKQYSYRFEEDEYKKIQGELWKLVKHFNEKVLPKNCQICSRIDLNSLLW